MVKCFFMTAVGVLIFISGSILAEVDSGEQAIKETILELHTSQGPRKKYIVWHECRKRLRKEKAIQRAGEYARAIKSSADLVYERTGKRVNIDHMVAILYRESSYDECVIGRQETRKLSKKLGREPNKPELIKYVRLWRKNFGEAKKVCEKRGQREGVDCVDGVMRKKYPEYLGIRGWDIGVAQYRWPGVSVRRRMVRLPSGRVIKKVGLDDMFDYEVSVQMLAEDMVLYKNVCKHGNGYHRKSKGHEHWLHSRWKHKVRKLTADEAYFAHHHTGTTSWSERYWRAVTRHLTDIKRNRADRFLARATLGSRIRNFLGKQG